MLTLDALVAAAAFRSEVATIEGLPAPARFRDISGVDRDAIVRFFHEAGEDAQARNWEFKRLVIGYSLCDDAGKRLLADDQIEPVLGGFGGLVIESMYEVAARVSGLTPASVEDAAKNSEAGQS